MEVTLIVLFAAVLFLAYANGANDNFKAVATLYGSRTLGYRKAVAWATASQVPRLGSGSLPRGAPGQSFFRQRAGPNRGFAQRKLLAGRRAWRRDGGHDRHPRRATNLHNPFAGRSPGRRRLRFIRRWR